MTTRQGARTKATCAVCGAAVRPKDRFCASCGSPIAAAQAAPAAAPLLRDGVASLVAHVDTARGSCGGGLRRNLTREQREEADGHLRRHDSERQNSHNPGASHSDPHHLPVPSRTRRPRFASPCELPTAGLYG